MAFVFLRQGKFANLPFETVGNRYNFTEGRMVINDDVSAKMMEPMLVGFYGCKMLTLEAFEHALQIEQERLARETKDE